MEDLHRVVYQVESSDGAEKNPKNYLQDTRTYQSSRVGWLQQQSLDRLAGYVGFCYSLTSSRDSQSSRVGCSQQQS